MIEEHHLEQLELSVVGEDGSGKEWICGCPLCGKANKLYVEKASGKWICFVCQEGGRSLRSLATKLGRPVPDGVSEHHETTPIEREHKPEPPSPEVRAVWEATVELGQKHITKGVRDYLRSRLPDETIAKFQLGEAVAGLIYRLCQERGFASELCVEAGVLVAPGDNYSHLRVRWAGAVLIPVRDAAGQVANLLYRLTDDMAQKMGGDRYHSLPGRPRDLFHAAAAVGAEELLVAEGPMDAMTLDALGFPAVGLPAASIIKPDFGAAFEGKRIVYVVTDNDDAGEKARKRLRRMFPGVPFADVRLPDGVKDANEWVAKHGATREDFERLIVEAIASPTDAEDPNEAAANATQPQRFALTDLGNAERLASRHRDNIRFINGRGGWHVWDERRWALDETEELKRRAAETVRSIYAEAENAPTEDLQKALWRHAVKSESAAKIEAMIKLAASLEGIVLRARDLDADHWLLNCANGMLDLRTGQLRPHERADLVTKLAPVDYDPDACCPTWERFLERVIPSPAVRSFLQRAAGYSLTGDTSEHCIFMLHGAGANGKSTYLEAMRHVVGNYTRVADSTTFLAKKHDRIPNDVAALVGARLVTVSETEGGSRLAAALVKNVTGGDTVTARFLYKEFFEFTPEFKLWLATNHKPEVADTSEGFWRRIRLIPFEVQIPAHERDKHLPVKLRQELAGILRWAVEGCLAWQRDCLDEPEEVVKATAAYREEQDPVSTFITECCILDGEGKTSTEELHSAYCSWAVGTGEPSIYLEEFGRVLGSKGLKACKVGKKRGWGGIRFLEGNEAPAARWAPQRTRMPQNKSSLLIDDIWGEDEAPDERLERILLDCRGEEDPAARFERALLECIDTNEARGRCATCVGKA
ncbi:MAG: phage/plasmid primase, P4 family [Pseudomonadota bacterium]